jgi:HEAT repeat protein
MSRQILASSLASIAADDPALILQNANSGAPLETEMCLDVLEAIGSEQALREILKLKNHPAPKVRARVVSLAGKMGDASAADIARSLIDDEDPLVRRRALVTITDVEGEKCEEFLTGVFTSKQFAMLSHDQKKGMLLVIKRLPQDVQDRIANSVLAMGGLFQRKSTQDTKKALSEVLNMKSETRSTDRPWRRRNDSGSE